MDLTHRPKSVWMGGGSLRMTVSLLAGTCLRSLGGQRESDYTLQVGEFVGGRQQPVVASPFISL